MTVKDIFAVRLRELREKAGLSQNKLAAELGISRGSISFYENGDRTADIETLDKVAQYFSVPTAYLLGYTNAKENNNVDIGEITGLSDSSIEKIKSLKCNSHLGVKYLNSIIESSPFLALMIAINNYLIEYISEIVQEEMDLLDFVKKNDLPLSSQDILERGKRVLNTDEQMAFDMFCQERRNQDGIIFDPDYSLYRIQKLFANEIIADEVISDILYTIADNRTYEDALSELKSFWLSFNDKEERNGNNPTEG